MCNNFYLLSTLKTIFIHHLIAKQRVTSRLIIYQHLFIYTNIKVARSRLIEPSVVRR